MAYRFLNRVLLAVGAMLAVAICVAHGKGVGDCGWRILFGKNCLFCGCTRDVIGIFNRSFVFTNPISPYVFAMLLGEFAFRGLGSCILLPARVWIVDAAFHGVMAIIFLVANFAVMFRQ